jgi:hypothetical protein
LSRVGIHLKEKLTRHADVDDPDDPDEADRLRREADDDARARFAHRGLRFATHHATGLAQITVLTDALTAAQFRGILDPLATHQPDHNGIRDQRTQPQRRADAFADLVTAGLGADQPTGRSRTAATITVDHETLTGARANAGLLDDGQPLDPATLRKLLCNAGITPVILGGRSAVLDLGHATRLFTHHQLQALAARDRGCVFGACPAPPARTHAHHMHHYADGGPTNLANGALLCDYHHGVVHRENWHMQLARNGHPELIPPATIDPKRKPRQHPRFRKLRR